MKEIQKLKFRLHQTRLKLKLNRLKKQFRKLSARNPGQKNMLNSKLLPNEALKKLNLDSVSFQLIIPVAEVNLEDIRILFKNRGGVYIIINKITGMAYPGSTVNLQKRMSYGHFSSNALSRKLLSNRRFENSLAKHGDAAFVLTIPEYVPQKVGENRRIYIKRVFSREQIYLDLIPCEFKYNFLLRADSPLGYPRTEETKLKIKLALKGRKQTDLQKKMLALANKERKHTDEAKQKMIASNNNRIAVLLTNAEKGISFESLSLTQAVKKLKFFEVLISPTTLRRYMNKNLFYKGWQIVSKKSSFDLTKMILNRGNVGRNHTNEARKKMVEANPNSISVQIINKKTGMSLEASSLNQAKKILISFDIKTTCATLKKYMDTGTLYQSWEIKSKKISSSLSPSLSKIIEDGDQGPLSFNSTKKTNTSETEKKIVRGRRKEIILLVTNEKTNVSFEALSLHHAAEILTSLGTKTSRVTLGTYFKNGELYKGWKISPLS